MNLRTFSTDRKALQAAFFKIVADDMGIGVAVQMDGDPVPDKWPDDAPDCFNPICEELRRHLARAK